MSRRARLLKRIAVSVVVVVGAIAAATVGPIDETPYFAWPAYHASLAEPALAGPPVKMVRGQLSAGFGRASLTPKLDGPENPEAGSFPGIALAGFSARRGGAATSVRDLLFAKAVAVEVGGERLVFVGVDLLIVPPSVTAILSRDLLPPLGLRREQLYLAATHTHSGLGGWMEGFIGSLIAGRYRPGVDRFVASAIAASVQAALDDLKPASLGIGRTEAPEFVKNRVIPTGRTDPAVPFLAFRQESGRTGVVASFAAHPTLLGPDNFAISADYPGALQRTLEGKGVDLALFMAGPVGSQAPAYEGPAAAAVDRIGSTLAERIAAALGATVFQADVPFAEAQLPLALPHLQVRFADHWRVRPWLARLFLPAPEVPVLQAVRLGSAVWLSTPSDYSGELAPLLQDRLARKGLAANVTSFNGDYVGYLLPGRYDHWRSYESRDMNFFGPGMGDYVQDLLERLSDRVSGPAPPAAPQLQHPH